MFTGIIQATAPVTRTTPAGKNLRVRIATPKKWKLTTGQSIAVDGICGTVVAKSPTWFDIEYIPETLAKTTAKSFTTGTIRNLERSLTLRDFIDGHLVLGHVDAKVKVFSIDTKNGHLVTVGIPKTLMKFMMLHGSVTVNGVALTIARKKGNTITVALVPHTLSVTNLKTLKKGDFVNLEVDLIARHLLTRGTVSLHATRT